MTPKSAVSTARPYLPLLLILFVGSGCAALIYEIVWFQLLELVVGSSAVSLGVLLGTFMGGMCLGSLLLPRYLKRTVHPLRAYAFLELGIGAFGVLIVNAMPAISSVYSGTSAHGMTGLLIRGVIAAICLLPPTLLMGATLPAVARWIESTPAGVSWLGFFYGSNIAGAVFGCLLAGFYLLRVHDMAYATYVAVAVNIAVALVGLALSNKTDGAPATGADGEYAGVEPASRAIYVVIALSGLTALGAEVIWTRILSLMLGATVYTFSIILAMVLVGLGIGSTGGSLLARSGKNARALLGWCQLLLPVTIAYTAYLITQSYPFWPINPSLSTSPWLYFQFDIMRCLFAVLPATILWGASFPLALAAVAKPGQDSAKLVGGVYAANTVGAIVGAVAFSVFLIPAIGTHGAQQALMAAAVIAALIALVPIAGGAQVGNVLAVGALVLLAAFAGLNVPTVPDGLVGYGRFLPTYSSLPKFLYVGEGMNSSVAVSELASGYRNFHVSGKIEASTEPQDMRLQRMLGHISALSVKDPQSVLIVGFGAGVTAGSFALYPGIKRIVICELEPLIPTHVGPYFEKENYNIANDPRVQIVYDDARHYVLSTSETFDVITSDPINPWVRGAATLYTKEYFELVKKHLNPGGVITQWVPLYESRIDVVKSEIATFMDVFPQGTVFGNTNNGRGYDAVLLGKNGDPAIDINAIHERLAKPEYARAAASLAEVGINSSLELYGNYAGRGQDLGPWMEGAQLNRDRNLRLQYLAGLQLNTYDSGIIYDDLLSQRKFPAGLFIAPDAWLGSLRSTIGAP